MQLWEAHAQSAEHVADFYVSRQNEGLLDLLDIVPHPTSLRTGGPAAAYSTGEQQGFMSVADVDAALVPGSAYVSERLEGSYCGAGRRQ